MGATSFVVTKDVSAPSSAVWSVLADYARDRDWREGVIMRQDPPGLATEGALTYEELRMFGMRKQIVARVEEVEPGRRLRFRTLKSDVPVTGERLVEPLGEGGSRVTVRIDMAPTGIWAVFRKPLAGMMRRRFADDLERLAALVESAT